MKIRISFACLILGVVLAGCGSTESKEKGVEVESSPVESNESKEDVTGQENILEDALYIGEYLDENKDPNLEIAKGEDGKYRVKIGIFRLASFDDGVGVLTEEGMRFTATDMAGNPIGGIITIEGQTATVTFTDSTWGLIENGTSYEYTKSLDKEPAQVKPETTKYSENILLSLNQGAPGYGTEIDCIDAEIFIYMDRSVRVMVYYPEETELMSFELTEEEYEKVMQSAEPSKVAKLKVQNDNDVCDGSSYHIALYDKNDERMVYKGGYMPIGKKFWETYDGLKEILEPYKIYEKLEEYRTMLQELEDGTAVVSDSNAEEDAEVFELLQGEWLCESGSAYLRFYEKEHNYYMDCYGDWQVHESVEYFSGAPLYELYYGYFDRWKEEEDILPENEIRVAYTTQKGEFDYGGEFVVDKNSAYLISELIQEDKAYYFYPYEGEMPIGNYVHIAPMAKRIGELVGDANLKYESLWQVAEKLVSSNLIYFYPGHGEVTVLQDGTYRIETIASGYKEIDGTTKAADYDLRFFIDEEGNPIKENEWEIVET